MARRRRTVGYIPVPEAALDNVDLDGLFKNSCGLLLRLIKDAARSDDYRLPPRAAREFQKGFICAEYSVKALTQKMGVSRATILRQLNELEEMRLIRRRDKGLPTGNRLLIEVGYWEEYEDENGDTRLTWCYYLDHELKERSLWEQLGVTYEQFQDIRQWMAAFSKSTNDEAKYRAMAQTGDFKAPPVKASNTFIEGLKAYYEREHRTRFGSSYEVDGADRERLSEIRENLMNYDPPVTNEYFSGALDFYVKSRTMFVAIAEGLSPENLSNSPVLAKMVETPDRPGLREFLQEEVFSGFLYAVAHRELNAIYCDSDLETCENRKELLAKIDNLFPFSLDYLLSHVTDWDLSVKKFLASVDAGQGLQS
ncbi:hypothetical protein D3C72_844200 [compost metagenome]